MSFLNSTIRTQLKHRTIRHFTGEPLPAEIMSTLFEVAQRTASSRCLQQASIVRVADPERRRALADVGHQAYMGESPELLVFIVDSHRNQSILDERAASGYGARSMDSFFEGWTDACLMAQNVVVAAESLGLGTNYFGNILNDPHRVIELLNLPSLTFPVVGLTMGYPAQDPQLKPRMPMTLRVMTDTYTEPSSMVAALRGYDAVMETYYDLREQGRRSDCFTDQVVSKLNGVTPERHRILRTIRSQGWDLALED